jgi:hypothetical protein
MAGRLPAQRVGHILVLQEEDVKRFKPGPSGRARTKAPPWRTYRSRGMLLATDIRVQVRSGQQEKLLEKLQLLQQAERHTFSGTVARYVLKGDKKLTTLHFFLVWKDTDTPDEETRRRDLTALKDELADVLDWRTAQEHTDEVILHT